MTDNTLPVGFMGNTAVCGSFLALCVPLLASRNSKWAIAGAIGLFIPIYITVVTLAWWTAGIGLGCVLWHKIPKKIWFALMAGVVLLCVFYVFKVEKPGYDTRLPIRKNVLSDGIRHPITGWGPDSFRNTTSYKNFRYRYGPGIIPAGGELNWWDNPHNLIISLFFEFGLVGLFLLGGYLRQCGIWFMRAVKDPNVVGLFGFLIVAVLISQAHFIMYLARTAIIVIIGAALFEVATKENA
jgi:hypothetical protein